MTEFSGISAVKGRSFPAPSVDKQLLLSEKVVYPSYTPPARADVHPLSSKRDSPVRILVTGNEKAVLLYWLKFWFFVVSRGFEDGARGAPDEVDHSDKGVGIAVSAGSGSGGFEQSVEALHAVAPLWNPVPSMAQQLTGFHSG